MRVSAITLWFCFCSGGCGGRGVGRVLSKTRTRPAPATYYYCFIIIRLKMRSKRIPGIFTSYVIQFSLFFSSLLISFLYLPCCIFSSILSVLHSVLISVHSFTHQIVIACLLCPGTGLGVGEMKVIQFNMILAIMVSVVYSVLSLIKNCDNCFEGKVKT